MKTRKIINKSCIIHLSDVIKKVKDMESTVTVRGQTAIPVAIRKRYNINPKTKLEWIDDGHTITVLPIHRDPIKALKGRFKDINLREALLKSRQEERKRG